MFATGSKPEIKMEEQSWSPEFGAQRFICPKTGRLREILLGEAQQNVKQEPNEEPSGTWDAQMKEFLKTVQDSHSGEGNPRVPETRHWDNPKALEIPSEGETSAHSWLRALCASQVQPHLVGEAQEDHEIHQNATPSGKEKAGTTSGDGGEMERECRCFRELRYQEADGPYKICRQLQARCRQWLKPETYTKEQILDLVTLEQFLTILPLEMQSWVRERNPRSCAWAVALAEEFLQRQKKANRWKVQQIIAMSEKEPVNLKVEQVLPGTVKRQLSILPKQGNDVSVNLLGDGRLSESKGQKRLRESSEQTEQEKKTLKAGKEKDFLCQGETVKSQRGAERPKRNDAEKEADPFIPQQAVCKNATKQHVENVMEHAMGGEICGQKAYGSTDEVIPTEETVYECSQCGRSFFSSSDLLIHERRSHVGEKLYKCFHCGKRETIRIGQNMHRCSNCGERFK